MKLAEALILRSDYQKRMEQLKHRLLQNAKIQEGETPNEDPKELKKELSQVLHQLKEVIQNINRTNLQTAFVDTQSLADALTERDLLGQERNIYSEILAQASMRHDRYSRSEIKFITPFNIKETQKYVDELSQKYRLVDTKIQELNWKTDLID
ncbi:delta 1-pyrroline-5-carboxylate dehydrogenase [Salirhabdus euzebyi]|uniref:Delta 1-pyrroline-5-carboxylate dehydrogenase n=1 Tax=Salirhabdus euzebyi TaxID=394506 RepID=A0A841PU12_9BACI|nr:DIP1984 family protein [Salirhabdus euzebyi]MBB6452477.1 delta 1-pyrroline-5-carboxylate dehydrogenase [Salirhabdus euzebyi]